jgi:hypothetical protein
MSKSISLRAPRNREIQRSPSALTTTRRGVSTKGGAR